MENNTPNSNPFNTNNNGGNVNQNPFINNGVTPPVAKTAPQIPTPPPQTVPATVQDNSNPFAQTKKPAAEGESAIVLDIKQTKKKEKEEVVKKVTLFNSINNYLINMGSIKLDEKLLFFQLLGSMTGAGLPIIDALNLLLAQTKNPKMKQVILDIRSQIEEGQSLAAAMRYNGDVFDEATCSVVEAGEKSGKLNSILKELVDQLEQVSTLSKKVKAVLTYPIIVVVFMFVLTGVVLIFVVPKLEELFGGGENLPLPTRILIDGSNFLLNYWIYLLIGGAIAAFLFVKWKKSEKGKKQWGMILLSTPLIGAILQKMILTRVTRIFGFLISAGVPIIESLKIASHIAESDVYKDKLLLAADDLTKGISIAENLSDDEKLFPPMLVNMMAIGEKTASLDIVMIKAADFYNEELERKIGMLEKSMEPIILAIISCGAVFMILAIYLPILQMNDQVVGSF